MCGTTCKKFGDEVVATKHDISKFMGYHGFIIIFNESNTSANDTLPKSLKLYIKQTPKEIFVHLHTLLVIPKPHIMVGGHVRCFQNTTHHPCCNLSLELMAKAGQKGNGFGTTLRKKTLKT